MSMHARVFVTQAGLMKIEQLTELGGIFQRNAILVHKAPERLHGLTILKNTDRVRPDDLGQLLAEPCEADLTVSTMGRG